MKVNIFSARCMIDRLNILFICSYFPPNSSVGGIRPFMFAHYLTEMGHNVTVLTGSQSDNGSRYDPSGEGFEMIFHRDFKPSRILLRGIRGGCLHRLVRPVKRNLAVMSGLCDVYKAASKIRDELIALRNRHRHFDVIFSTYGNLTAVVSGWDAKRILGCKWILDFRDPLIQKKSRPWLWNALARLFFVRFARKADLCTCVTDGFSEIMTSYGVKAQTLYNGFSDCQNVPAHYTRKGNHLKICYTGSFYTGGLEDKALASLLGAVRALVDTGRLGLNDIRFTFAGRKTDKAGPVFRKFGLESMFESRGMLSGDEAVRLQQESDVFLVLSWNMTDEYGVVPAKTYEGMKEGRVILASVHGNLPNSELSLIVKKYNLGFCYEDSLDGDHFSQLCSFIVNCVKEKKSEGKVTCCHKPTCRRDFHYRALASYLEKMIQHNLLETMPSLKKGGITILDSRFPSERSLYEHPFVYSRVKEYMASEIDLDVLCIKPGNRLCYRVFDGIGIYEGTDLFLNRFLASLHSTRTICVHFLNRYIWEQLKPYLGKIRLVLFCHGSDIIPYEYYIPILGKDLHSRKYGMQKKEMWNDVFSRAESANVHIVFVSEYLRNIVRNEYGIGICNSSVIHNFIDTDLFEYIPKPADQRFKILSIKSYRSRIYANDITRAAILILSHYEIFSRMTFDLYGDGTMFEEDTRDLDLFPNVNVHRGVLSHQQIASLHKTHGVFLAPTRMDTQGCSRDEAMSSGLVPITNPVAAVPEFVDGSCAMLVESESPQAVADAILTLSGDPELFKRMSAAAAAHVRQLSSRKQTVDRELQLILTNSLKCHSKNHCAPSYTTE